MLKSQPFRVYHRRLLCQDAADSLWHYPPQAFFRQQISDGRKKFVQRLFQLFNWHLGEDLCKRYIHHGSASWVRSADKQTLPQLAELLFFTYTCGHSPDKIWFPEAFTKQRLCESLGLTPAASGGKRDFGVWLVGCADQPHPKPLSVKI